jgi:hypothetical protein
VPVPRFGLPAVANDNRQTAAQWLRHAGITLKRSSGKLLYALFVVSLLATLAIISR